MDPLEKQRLRGEMRRVLKTEYRGQQPCLSSLTGATLWGGVTCILIYAPLPDEPDMTPLESDPLSTGKRFLYPRVAGDTLELFERTSSSRWITGPYGLSEPDPDTWIAVGPDAPDCALIPGLAFDARGYRLGRGKGYYDRLLGSPLFRGIRIGVAWRGQIIDRVPAEAHDIPMDWLLTPDGLTTAG
jgi:5-formyltetrahydrofolate cyclo-ligase